MLNPVYKFKKYKNKKDEESIENIIVLGCKLYSGILLKSC